MKRSVSFLSLFIPLLLIAGNGTFDPRIEHCVFSVSGGMSLSANDFSKGNDGVKPGFVTRMHFPSCGFLSFVLEYHHLFPFSIDQTWVDVKARDHDANVFFGRQFQGGNSSFYAFTGLCIKSWEATYTGIGENKITGFFVPVGSRTQLLRFCANLGVALEKHINDLSFFGDFRFRLSPVQENVRIEIMDIMYSLGLKYNLVFKKEDKFRKSRFRMPGRKYDLD